ncbi:hypothetical protein [Streptomyces sp. NPDC006012]|uniref:hypothetical protein n=1 Tax=Streptomyces sp. NPDC006012 TaxID=3364739 RepID=UPI0036CDFD49
MERGAPPAPAGDRHWRGSARFAVVCAVVFGALTVLTDCAAGTFTPARAVLWLALSATIGLLLLPPRVAAGRGWLSVRGPLSRRTVRTDALVGVRQYEGAASQLVFRDVHGGRLELDTRVLAANPFLWHEVGTGLRHSLHNGTLLQGADVLHRLERAIDDEGARAVLKASGMS